jgi:hypothetical protein
MFRLEVRLSDDGDLNVLASQISGHVACDRAVAFRTYIGGLVIELTTDNFASKLFRNRKEFQKSIANIRFNIYVQDSILPSFWDLEFMS